MLENPYVEMLGSISLIMAIIVGYAVMLFIVLAVLIYPIAKLGQKLVRKLLRIKSGSGAGTRKAAERADRRAELGPVREYHFDRWTAAAGADFCERCGRVICVCPPSTDPFPPLSDVRFKDEPTQTILPPTTVPSWQLEDIQQMPGLSYLAGRPIEANSEDTQFMDKITTMHHQI